MRIEIDIGSVRQTGQSLNNSAREIEQMQQSLRRAMDSLTMQCRSRSDVDGTFRQIDRQLGELCAELEQLSQFAIRKSEQFAEDDAYRPRIEACGGEGWLTGESGLLNFVPILKQAKEWAEGIAGKGKSPGGKGTAFEQALAAAMGEAGRIGGGIGAFAKEAWEEGRRFAKKGAAAVSEALDEFKERAEQPLGVTWDFVQGAKEAIQEDLTFGIAKEEKEYEHPLAERAGEVTGHAATTVQGALETLTGVGGAAASGALDLTIEGAILGVPAMAASAALAAHGLNIATKGAGNTGSSARDLVQMIKGEGEAVHIKAPNLPEGSEWERNVLNSFAGGKSELKIYGESTTLYRISDKNGGFWSITPPPATEFEWRVNTAIKQEWGNNASNLYTMTVPKGSSISGLDGTVGSQGMGLHGGAHQVYIDFKAVPESWITTTPLK